MSIISDQNKTFSYERFHYNSPNGVIEGFAVVPKSDFPCPVILFCRGGNRNFGAIDEKVATNLMLPLALAGFAVIGTQYSGGPNSGGKDEFGGKDLLDVFSLLEEIKKSSWKLDFSKIGLLGISRGAMMGMQALRDGLPVQKAAFIGGLYDAQKTKEERPDLFEMWVNDKMFDVLSPAELKKRSAVRFPEKLPNIPFLLLHSKGDSRVPVRQAIDMKNCLGDRAELVLFEGDDHGLRMAGKERNEKLIEWFSKM